MKGKSLRLKYDYFGNTSLRVKNLLYNFETQLILFDDLFANSDKDDVWSDDSDLQIRYLELLEQHSLLESKNKKTQLGTKDARVKSAPLEDYDLINRKQKIIKPKGYELLELIKTESYKLNNDFLQIDLISLFFLKATLNFLKSEGLLKRYLEVFRAFDGVLSVDDFKFLSLINNFKNIEDFILNLKNKTIINGLVDLGELEDFLKDLKNNTLKIDYFKTAKGNKTALSILAVLKEIFLPFRIDSSDLDGLKSLISSNCQERFVDFKINYLKHTTKSTKQEQKIEDLKSFICEGDIDDFGSRFYRSIMESKISSNLNDYFDLNRRYLNLTGIFEFERDKVSLNTIFKMILKHPQYDEILKKISTESTSTNFLNEYFRDKEFVKYFETYGIREPGDLKIHKQKEDIQRLQKLVKESFSKEKVIEFLELFDNRKNDDKISRDIQADATIPTIFEYIIAIAWHYIDNGNLNRILQAGLSLDSNLLPKSHAVGGGADFTYQYNDHFVIIEATLTEKTNQRRAEMESVSRHLGNLLLDLDHKNQQKSYGIFVAPHLDVNVLNDFRSRIYCYFENKEKNIKGMNILPLSTEDLIQILKSNKNYAELLSDFYETLQSPNDWGSKWYYGEVKHMIEKLGNV